MDAHSLDAADMMLISMLEKLSLTQATQVWL